MNLRERAVKIQCILYRYDVDLVMLAVIVLEYKISNFKLFPNTIR